ncbi:hypothetical protein LUX29_05140 [Aureimonas altamirensis]|uniref:hypothetical protein n=1 Tax=Aureimonas altamirensis TaxID=370622 RepID=UPI001E324C34|nr:hypothetical protein [Aureimonas altamirensis]UHD46602.1 hypothetical protein LUX29_05140 [Aureimonas altamirensis]
MSRRTAHLRDLLTQGIPCGNEPEAARTALQSLPLCDLIAVYLNWVDRLIPPRRRTVFDWDGFWARNSPATKAAEINDIINLSNSGGDLEPYLSRRVWQLGYAPARKGMRGIAWADGRTGDKDLALNAYGVHHLHLAPADAAGRRKGTSRPLLYVGVSRRELLLLMLGDHNSPNDGTLHRAVAEHRAQTGWDLKGVTASRENLSDAKSVAMLRRGVGVATQVEEKVVMPALISYAGTAIEIRMHADRVASFLEHWDERLSEGVGRREFAEQFGVSVNSDDFGWAFWYGDFLLTHENASRAICLIPWKR